MNLGMIYSVVGGMLFGGILTNILLTMGYEPLTALLMMIGLLSSVHLTALSYKL